MSSLCLCVVSGCFRALMDERGGGTESLKSVWPFRTSLPAPALNCPFVVVTLLLLTRAYRSSCSSRAKHLLKKRAHFSDAEVVFSVSSAAVLSPSSTGDGLRYWLWSCGAGRWGGQSRTERKCPPSSGQRKEPLQQLALGHRDARVF